MKSLRVLAIWLVFTMEVKVKADVQIVELTGPADIFSAEKTAEFSKSHSKFQIPLETELLGPGIMRLKSDTWTSGITLRGHLRVNSGDQIDLFSGKMAIKASFTSGSLQINARQGIIKIVDGECVISSEGTRTMVSVARGKVILWDRASNKEYEIKEGFSRWIGGLTSRGQREVGALEAASFDTLFEDLRHLMAYSDSEIKEMSDSFLPTWEKAVQTVAAQRQNQIKEDFLKLDSHLKKQALNRQRQRQEQAAIRKMYRARVLGGPGPDKEVPSEWDRTPANSDE